MYQKLLQRPIAFHRCFAQVAGSATSGLFLSQLWYWHDRGDSEWIYKTYDEWQEETCLSRSEIDRARKQLKSLGILDEKKEGVPCRLYYRINEEALFCLIEDLDLSAKKTQTRRRKQQSSLQNPANCSAESDEPVCRIQQTVAQNPANCNAESSKHSIYRDYYIDYTETTQRPLSETRARKTETEKKVPKEASPNENSQPQHQPLSSLTTNELEKTKHPEALTQSSTPDPYFGSQRPSLIERQRQKAKDDAIVESPFQSVEEADQFYVALKRYVSVTARKGLTEGNVTGISKACYNRLLSNQSDPEDREILRKWQSGELTAFLDERVDRATYQSAKFHYESKKPNQTYNLVEV